MTIINANNLILGRMGSEVAKRALVGEEIHIVNCGDAIITGNKKGILEKHAKRRARGTPTTGPFIQRRADMFVKRTIRGMLPYKRPRGRRAMSRIKCHLGVPNYLTGKELKSMKSADMAKLPNLKYVKVGEICRLLGA